MQAADTTVGKPGEIVAGIPYGLSQRAAVESNMSDAEYRLYQFLVNRMGSQGYVTFSQRYVAKCLGWGNYHTVGRNARSLADRGYIILTHGTRGKSDRFTVAYCPVRGMNPWGVEFTPNYVKPKRTRKRKSEPIGIPLSDGKVSQSGPHPVSPSEAHLRDQSEPVGTSVLSSYHNSSQYLVLYGGED